MTTEVKKDVRNVHQRFLAAMMEAGYVQKETKQVNNQYRFVSHDGVVREVRPALLKNGITIESEIVEWKLELQEVTETIMAWDNQAKAKMPVMDKDGKPVVKTSMGYCCTILAKFYFVNSDNPSDRFFAHGLGQGIDSQDKAVGKAMSYSKKNALIWAMLLEGGDDPEKDVDYSIGNKPEPKPEVKKEPISKTKQFFVDYYKDLAAASDEDSLNIVLISNKDKLKEMLATYAPDARMTIEADVVRKEQAAKERINQRQ